MEDLIINKFGFDEDVYHRLGEYGFDIESLVVATESELNELFPAPLLGLRAKFKYHLNRWRQTVSAASLRIGEMENCPLTANFVPVNSSTLVDLLSVTLLGRDVLKEYNDKGELDDVHRDVLVSLIVNQYFNNKKGMAMSDIENAVDAIVTTFPTEDPKSYLIKRGHGRNPTGKLHDKAVNARVKLRKFVTRQTVEPRVEENEINAEHSVRGENESEAFLWLSHNNEPWMEVEQNWKATVNMRQQDIQNDVVMVLKWPLLKHAHGYLLIDLDYNLTKKDHHSQLFALWPEFKVKVIPYFNEHIKDRPSRKLLKTLDGIKDESKKVL